MKPYYEQDGVTIYHGDCREILPSLGRFDLLLTDPPYGIGASAGTGKYGREKWSANDPQWDNAAPPRWLLEMVIASAEKAIVWGGNYFPLPPTRNYLIWDKGAGFKGRDFAECEMAWCSWDANARIFLRDPLASKDYAGKTHPTQKPVALMKWCIDIAGAPKTIIDPFAGVGSTGRAAKDYGLSVVLIEAREEYCESAVRLMAQAVLPMEFSA